MITENHPEWAGYRKWLDKQIDNAHLALENEGLPLDGIRSLQGEIRAYRAVIEAAKVTVTESPNTPGYFD